MEQVRKRNNKVVPYNPRKIYLCIRKANADCKDARMPRADILAIIKQIETTLGKYKAPSVETIQDEVEKALMRNGWENTAKAYIIYRNEHAKVRDTHESLMKKMMEITFSEESESDYKRSNANINSNSVMGAMLQYGTTVSNYFNDNYIIPKRFIDAHRNGLIHIHDKDFSELTWNCCQIDLQELLHNGFKVGQSTIREPNSIRATAALACIALQSNQNDQFGGQSIQDFDRAMAIGVRKTYKKAFLSAVFDDASYECGNDMAHRIVDYVKTKTLPTYLNDAPIAELVAQCDENIDKDKLRKILTHSYQSACKHTEEETYQAMESLLFNLNTMRSRAGGQMPFSSINFGLDTTAEGRLAMKQFLLVQEKGLGHGETSIFPISIMRLKKGISYNKEDVNYDIFKLAMRVSAKRLFPNFVSVDAPYNAQYYKEDDYRTEIAVMGCRTRVIGNVNGPQISAGRGNFSFTTINLPKIAIESNHDIKAFYKKLDKTMKLCKEQLLWRFNRIGKRHAYNYPFLIGNGVWKGGEKLKLDDTVDVVLKQASLSIGFVGLAECLVSLIGEHHGQSERAQQLGLDIIGKMREMTDKYTSETHLNFSLFASPAESVAGRMLRVTREQYGVIKGVTDHDFFTNSSHVPVYYPITAMDKIRIEAPYHALCNAGCIGYIEMDGDPTKNLEAFERVVRAMHDADMSYFAINHPVDRCPACGNTTIINGHVCPICGYDEEVHDQKIHMKFDMPMCCN